jgi:hypothetical protein
MPPQVVLPVARRGFLLREQLELVVQKGLASPREPTVVRSRLLLVVRVAQMLAPQLPVLADLRMELPTDLVSRLDLLSVQNLLQMPVVTVGQMHLLLAALGRPRGWASHLEPAPVQTPQLLLVVMADRMQVLAD